MSTQLFILALLVGCALQVNIEKTSIKNFDAITPTADDVVVFAIDKSSKRSRTFIPEMPNIADALAAKYPKLKFLQVDNDEKAKEDDVLFEKYDLLDLPGLLYFRKGVLMIMSSLKVNQTNAMEFIDRRVNVLPVDAASLEAAEKIDSSNFTVYYSTKNKKVDDWMVGLSAKYNKYKFVRLANLDIANQIIKKQNLKLSTSANSDTIILAKRPHDDHWFILPAVSDLDSILKFIRKSMRPAWTYFNTRTIDLVQNTDKYVALLKYDSEKDESFLQKVIKVADTYYSDCIFVFIPFNSQQGEDMLLSFGLPERHSDLFVIRKEDEKRWIKFVAPVTASQSASRIEDFLQSVLEERVKPYLLSEPVPTKELFEGVTTVVSKTLTKMVLNDKSVIHLVFFYDQESASQIPTFQKISKQFNKDKIRFYIFNLDKNEHEDVVPEHYGSIVLFSQKGKKRGIERTFNFDKHLKGKELLAFLKDTLSNDQETSQYLDTIQLTEDL